MRFPNPMNYDSDVDYYEDLAKYYGKSSVSVEDDFEEESEDEFEDTDTDTDCTYWASNCYGKG